MVSACRCGVTIYFSVPHHVFIAAASYATCCSFRLAYNLTSSPAASIWVLNALLCRRKTPKSNLLDVRSFSPMCTPSGRGVDRGTSCLLHIDDITGSLRPAGCQRSSSDISQQHLAFQHSDRGVNCADKFAFSVGSCVCEYVSPTASSS